MDLYGRRITYLRLSVTDRCNLRCRYCMPLQDFTRLPSEAILTYEEIVRICQILTRLGVKKIRLTGGEPLVRQGIMDLIGRLGKIEGIGELCLTTNGVLLKKYAGGLFRAGVRHLNISLDSLRPERFAAVTGRDLFSSVWKSLETVLEMGFSPVKINSVIMKGINDDEIPALAGLTLQHPFEVRFIEFMPIGGKSTWSPEKMMPCREIKERIEEAYGALKPVARSSNAGPANVYGLEGAPGRIGFISPLSNHFCGTCNRLRLTAEGHLRLCLFSDEEINVKEALRKGMTLRELTEFFRQAVRKKPEGYRTGGRRTPSCSRGMSAIGG